jgi:hypothetical protein
MLRVCTLFYDLIWQCGVTSGRGWRCGVPATGRKVSLETTTNRLDTFAGIENQVRWLNVKRTKFT